MCQIRRHNSTLEQVRFLLSILIFGSLPATSYSQMDSTSFVPNQVLVQLFSLGDTSSIEADHSDIGLQYDHMVFDELKIISCSFASLVNMDSCLTMLRLDTLLIANVQPNYYVHSANNNTVPNDPQFGSQYALNLIDAPEAWDISTGGQTVQGDQIVVAVLDDGFDLTHADLNFWKNQHEIPGNGLDDDGNGYPDDFDGWNAINQNGNLASAAHGTHVAGIIGAIGNNGVGTTGLNWNVGIMPIQASNGPVEAILRAYEYVYTMRELYDASGGTEGAFIVATNASFGFHGTDWRPSQHPFWCQVFDLLGTDGILNVNAPTNRTVEIGSHIFTGGWNNMMPAMCGSSYLIVVTNTNETDELHDAGSGIGSPWSTGYVDIAAPGVGILSTVPGGTGYDTGTSMAAPLVTGTIALLYAAACSDLIDEYRANPASGALSMRSKVINGADYVPSLIPLIGGGRLNAQRSLYGILEQQETDLVLTGTETDPESYAAIRNINAYNYSSSHQLDVFAGEQINIEPTSLLEPTGNEGQTFTVNPSYFACSVPFDPLELHLVLQEPVNCNSPLGVACNALVYGGRPPYTYQWYSRAINESTWSPSSASYPTMLFFYNDNFHVRVSVTDDRGETIESNEALVLCPRALFNSTAGESSSASYEANLSAWVYPNPSDGSSLQLRIKTRQTEVLVTATIIDQFGRFVWRKEFRSDGASEYESRIDLHGTLASGTYGMLIESSCCSALERFMVLGE